MAGNPNICFCRTAGVGQGHKNKEKDRGRNPRDTWKNLG